MYSKVEISNIVVRGVEVIKSEIRLKSENLHPCYDSCHLARVPNTILFYFLCWLDRTFGDHC